MVEPAGSGRSKIRAEGFLTIFFYAAEAKLGQPVLMAEVVRVQLKDENGNLLAEM